MYAYSVFPGGLVSFQKHFTQAVVSKLVAYIVIPAPFFHTPHVIKASQQEVTAELVRLSDEADGEHNVVCHTRKISIPGIVLTGSLFYGANIVCSSSVY